MNVKELIEMLEECDPEAKVKFMSQPSYPLEHSIGGIVRRKTFTVDINDNAEDVFLLEGGQTKYGSKNAWEVDFYDADCNDDDEEL
jgi:hypothetical protein